MTTQATRELEARARGPKADFVLFSSDHRRIAWSFAILIGLALVVGTFLAMGLAVRPLGDAMGQSEVDLRRLYTLHGLVMVFLVALPVVPGVFGNALLPRLLGIEEMAWPRANLLAFHLFLAGLGVLTVAALASTPDTGWTLDTPFSITHGSGVWWSAIAITLLCASTLCASANIVATFWSKSARESHGTRSVFAWSLVVGALVQAFAAAVLGGALFVLVAERAGASSLWSGAVLPQQSFMAWFWLAMHAALGAVVVLALGLLFHVTESASESEPRSADGLSIACLAAIAVSSLFGFGVHMPGLDVSVTGSAATSALALASGLPFALLLSRLWTIFASTRARLSTALCWAIASVAFTVTGGVAAIALAVLPSAVFLEHTTYPTGVFHLLFAGGLLSAVFAGLHSVWQEWFGVAPASGSGKLACFLYFVGAELAFLPQLVDGAFGAARRGGASETVSTLGAWSAAGSLLLAVAGVLLCWNLLSSVSVARSEERA